ncbi:MAG: hypothetical protein IJO20_04880 [Ruminococcus sp.]|nr:hypothetical protein [Ruminococcus sp.]
MSIFNEYYNDIKQLKGIKFHDGFEVFEYCERFNIRILLDGGSYGEFRSLTSADIIGVLSQEELDSQIIDVFREQCEFLINNGREFAIYELWYYLNCNAKRVFEEKVLCNYKGLGKLQFFTVYYSRLKEKLSCGLYEAILFYLYLDEDEINNYIGSSDSLIELECIVFEKIQEKDQDIIPFLLIDFINTKSYYIFGNPAVIKKESKERDANIKIIEYLADNIDRSVTQYPKNTSVSSFKYCYLLELACNSISNMLSRISDEDCELYKDTIDSLILISGRMKVILGSSKIRITYNEMLLNIAKIIFKSKEFNKFILFLTNNFYELQIEFYNKEIYEMLDEIIRNSKDMKTKNSISIFIDFRNMVFSESAVFFCSFEKRMDRFCNDLVVFNDYIHMNKVFDRAYSDFEERVKELYETWNNDVAAIKEILKKYKTREKEAVNKDEIRIPVTIEDLEEIASHIKSINWEVLLNPYVNKIIERDIKLNENSNLNKCRMNLLEEIDLLQKDIDRGKNIVTISQFAITDMLLEEFFSYKNSLSTESEGTSESWKITINSCLYNKIDEINCKIQSISGSSSEIVFEAQQLLEDMFIRFKKDTGLDQGNYKDVEFDDFFDPNDNLLANIKTELITSEILFNTLVNYKSWFVYNFDYSPALLPLTKSLEMILGEIIKDIVKENSDANKYISNNLANYYLLDRNNNYVVNNDYKVILQKQSNNDNNFLSDFALGALIRFLEPENRAYLNPGQKTVQAHRGANILNHFADWKIGEFFDDRLLSDLKGLELKVGHGSNSFMVPIDTSVNASPKNNRRILCAALHYIRANYRNKVAHSSFVQRTQYEECKELMMESEKMIWILLYVYRETKKKNHKSVNGN